MAHPPPDQESPALPIGWNDGKTAESAFKGSTRYWEQRYAAGGHSGVGSQGYLADYKGEVINALTDEFGLKSAIEWGCGDGNVLSRFAFETYVGADVSQTVIDQCREKYGALPGRSFVHVSEAEHIRADMSLSLDVIFHLIEESVFEAYMRNLFGSARKCVVIYSNNHDDQTGCVGTHVRNRLFTRWIEENIKGWRLERHIPNKYPPKDGDYRTGSFSDFYVYIPRKRGLFDLFRRS